MTSQLFLFVDSLPWKVVEEEKLLRWLPSRGPMRPGVGYSFTQKAEVFRGLLPDQLGYLNYWRLTGARTAKPNALHNAAHAVRDRAPWVDKLIHYGIARVVKRTANIPFELVGRFTPGVPDTYEPTPPSLLAEDWTMLVGERMKLKDLDVVARARQATEGPAPPRRVFLGLAELDKHGHEAGPDGAQYRKHARDLDAALADLAARMASVHGGCEVGLFSDHGMLRVDRTRHLPGRLFDLPGGRRAAYWLDSTMVRVWTDTPEEALPVAERLRAVPDVQLLDEKERAELGVASRAFGDIIGYAAPGAVFRPNHFGVGKPGGMHGYHPDHAPHHATWAHSAPGDAGLLTTLQVHRRLKEVLASRP